MKEESQKSCFHWWILGLIGFAILGMLINYFSKNNAKAMKEAATNVAKSGLADGQFSFANAHIDGAKMVVTGNAANAQAKAAACAAVEAELKKRSMLGLPGVVAIVSCQISAPGDEAAPTNAVVATNTKADAKLTEKGNDCQLQLNEAASLGAVQFAKGKSEIIIGQNVLDQISEVAKECKDFKIEIGGHTDTGGDAAMNQNLSQIRAEAVMAYLVSKGVDAANLTAKGYGESKPLVADNAVIGVDSELRQKNRRTEFTIINN